MMKIGYFAPEGREDTVKAAFSALGRVECFPLPTGETAPASLSGYDLLLYRLGDDWDRYGPVYNLAGACPGVVVMEDASLRRFFGGYSEARGEDGEALFRRLYGERALREIRRRKNHRRHGDQADPAAYSLLEGIQDRALGAIALSAPAERALRLAYSGPIALMTPGCREENQAAARRLWEEIQFLAPSRRLIGRIAGKLREAQKDYRPPLCRKAAEEIEDLFYIQKGEGRNFIDGMEGKTR